MEAKKQTAVDWFIEQINSDCLNSVFINQDLIIKAKKMEKEQVIDSYLQKRGKRSITGVLKCWDEAEQYYTETYGE
jgi:hypothetical protein